MVMMNLRFMVDILHELWSKARPTVNICVSYDNRTEVFALSIGNENEATRSPYI